MKFVAFALALLAISVVAMPRDRFEAWKIKYDKSYATSEEEEFRFHVFTQNLQVVEARNARARAEGAHPGFSMNVFADISEEEFRARYLSPMPMDRKNLAPTLDMPSGDVIDSLPSSFSWLGHNPAVVTPVKNQGQCGSCWAFSATENIESIHALAGNDLVELSPQDIVDCSNAQTNGCVEYEGEKVCNEGCNGGLMMGAFNTVMFMGGVDTEESYPYEGVQGTCRFSKANVGATISNWTMVAANEQAVMAALIEHGPLSIAADASEWQLWDGHEAVFDWPCGTSLDHGVMITGYGTHKTILGKEIPYWEVRNSWGASWNGNGYLRVLRGKQSKGGECGVLLSVCTSIIN